MDQEIQRITQDLHIPMLTDIRRAVQQVQHRQVGDRFDGEALQQAVREAIGNELDARGAQGRRSVRDVIAANIPSDGAAGPAGASGAGGRVMFRLGRVRSDMLEEGEEILGEGAFGVKAGEYMGQEVAIKKAKIVIGDPSVLREFRWEVGFCPILGIRCDGLGCTSGGWGTMSINTEGSGILVDGQGLVL